MWTCKTFPHHHDVGIAPPHYDHESEPRTLRTAAETFTRQFTEALKVSASVFYT